MKAHQTMVVTLLLVVAGLIGLAAKVLKPIARLASFLQPWEQQFEAMTSVYLMQLSVRVRTAKAAAYETEIGAAPIIDLYDAEPPANCAAGPAGNLVARGVLPSDWLAAAAAGAVGKTGTWTLTGVLVGGTARSFRIYRAGSPSECDIQGTVGPTGSPSYDMGVDNVNIANGQTVTVTNFTITEGNS